MHPWTSLHPNSHLVHLERCPKRPSAHLSIAVHFVHCSFQDIRSFLLFFFPCLFQIKIMMFLNGKLLLTSISNMLMSSTSYSGYGRTGYSSTIQEVLYKFSTRTTIPLIQINYPNLCLYLATSPGASSLFWKRSVSAG